MTTALAWEGWGPADAIDPVLPGFLVSAFLMVVVSLLTPPPPASATEPYMSPPASATEPYMSPPAKP